MTSPVGRGPFADSSRFAYVQTRVQNAVATACYDNNNNKIDYSVRNDKVTARALQESQGKND